MKKLVKISYIGGGSTGWAKMLMSDLLVQGDLSGELVLYDIDMKAAERNKKYFDVLIREKRDEMLSSWSCTTQGDLNKALEGSNFVVISITPGTLDNMEDDVHLPEEYGILQSVGDTVGPGGYSRALRAIPIYREFARRIREVCPDAWIINYTNPMTLCVATLYKEFPKIKAFGCCHEIFKSQKLLAEAYKQETGSTLEIDRQEIKVNVQGINHFTWINEAKYGSIDLLPYYEKMVEKYAHDGFKGIGLKKANKYEESKGGFDPFKSSEKLKFDLFKRMGLVAAAGDRHLAEFIPSTYLKDKKEAEERYGFYLTPVEFRRKKYETRKMEIYDQAEGRFPVFLDPTDEEGVEQMTALSGINTFVTNVNLPNVGQAPDLPIGSIVETNAVFRGDSLTPVFSGEMSPVVRNLVYTHALNQKNFIDAYFEGDINKVFETFYSDPSVARLSHSEARELFKKLVVKNKEYIEPWILERV